MTPTATASPSPSPSPAATRVDRIHYVAIGASDSVGVGATDPANLAWPARINALLPGGSGYRNVAVSGSLTAQAQREQLPLALGEQPTVVTVWLAVNDLNAAVPPLDYAASLSSIIDALVAATSARIFVGNVPDLRAVPLYENTPPEVLLAAISAYNSAIESAATRHPSRVVRVDLFTGSAELIGDMTVSEDGFHPSDAGYALIAERFAEAMRAAGVPLREED